MATYAQRQRTTVRNEYVLSNPVNQAEFSKAISAAYSDYSSVTGRNIADDSIWITHADNEIIIYWEEN